MTRTALDSRPALPPAGRFYRRLAYGVVSVALAAITLSPDECRAEAPSCGATTTVAKLVKDANSAFGAGKFAEALDAYTGAYGCNHDASLLFNIGKADLQLGKYIEGLDAMRRFEHDSTDLPKEVRAAADDVLKELGTHVGTLSVHSKEPGAHVTVDTRDAGAAPVENLEAAAGSITVRVTAPGREPEVRKIDLGGGQHLDVDVQFPEKSVPGTDAPKKTVFVISPLAWTGIAVTGAGLIVGIGTGAASLAQTNDIKAQCNGKLCPPSTADARSKATALANASDAMFVIAGAGAVVGVIGIALSGHRSAPATAVLQVTPGGVTVAGRF